MKLIYLNNNNSKFIDIKSVKNTYTRKIKICCNETHKSNLVIF